MLLKDFLCKFLNLYNDKNDINTNLYMIVYKPLGAGIEIERGRNENYSLTNNKICVHNVKFMKVKCL